MKYSRVVHGSILCDPSQPNPSADWPNPTQPNPTHYKWKKLDLTRPNPIQLTNLTAWCNQMWSSHALNALTEKSKGIPYSIIERRVPELIPVLGSQPAGDVSHKPGGRLPLLSARPAVTPATLKRAATNFAAWWTEAQWVWTVCLRLLPDSVATAIWTQTLLCLSPER